MNTSQHLAAVLLLLLAHTPATAAEPKPLKVFILAGQSNMQGHAEVSTFDFMADDPKTAALLKEMLNADGTPKVCEKVWITSVGCLGDAYTDLNEQTGKLTAGFGAGDNKIGPEFTFGLTMEKLLGEPVLIIKTSWGGRSLHTDFRPPSAGQYVWSDYELNEHKQRGDDLNKAKAEKSEASGVYYREMIKHVRYVLGDIQRVMPEYDKQQGYELAGFVWFQGFNDLVSSWTYENDSKPGGYDLYRDLLVHLIRDVRNDLSAPKLPFVIGVMGIGGEKEGAKPPQLFFRQAQAAPAVLPEFQGNVIAVQTSPFWDDRLGEIDTKHVEIRQTAHLLSVKDKNRANADGSMNEEQQQEYMKEFEAKLITPEEAVMWKRGASNGGYHYLGAAKILAPIGQAFAKAIVELRATPLPDKK